MKTQLIEMLPEKSHVASIPLIAKAFLKHRGDRKKEWSHSGLDSSYIHVNSG
jgi:hypothetical protein